MAYVAMWRGKGGGLQLNSVGHVNHTAIYLAIMLGVAISWLFAAWRGWPVWARALALFASAAILLGLVTTASRGAIAVGLLMLLVLGAGWWRRSRVPLQTAAAALAAIVLVMFAGGAEVLHKHYKSLESDNVLSYRGEVWSMAVSTWQRHPWFGVGMGNFGQMTPYRDRAARSKSGAAYDTTQALEFAHAHSLFFNTLAERGVIGSLALGALLAAWLFFLVRDLPPGSTEDEAWLLWGGAVAAWTVTAGVGLVNTTLHHEHGILAAMLLGLWLSDRLRARRN
jgi:O-antigen ligase